MAEHDALFRETVARHFPAAQIRDDEIELGFASLRLRCRVNAVKQIGSTTSASLFFLLRGGKLGESPVFASISGYGDTAEIAIISGACNWACAFGPMFRAALAGEEQPEVAQFDVMLDGQPFRVFVDGLDRAASFEGRDAMDRIAPARARFAPRSWLTRAVIESGRLPLLNGHRPTVLSVFVSDMPNHRVVEVKVDGVDWPGMEPVFASAAEEPPGAMVLLRELAVLVPTSPAPALSRDFVARTLRGLTQASSPRNCVDWPGWKQHGGVLAPTLTADATAALEGRVGSLPADYRDFLASVGASGAGPGYGLLSPLADAQVSFARGSFAWEQETKPSEPPHGVLVLAHAGCGVMWLLVLDGQHRGEVWVDARSSDGKVRRVASSFSSWYRDWLSSSIRDAVPWLQWDTACCSTAHALSRFIESLERDGVSKEAIRSEVTKRLKPGAMSVMSTGSSYFPAQTKLNPCHGCVSLVAQFNRGPNLFQPGEEPFIGAPGDSPKPGRGWFAKLADKVRGGRS